MTEEIKERVTAKKFKIERCYRCPNCIYSEHWDYYYCNLTDRTDSIIDDEDLIPGWCPLSDY